MADTPAFLKDAKDLLTEQGFSTSDTWYHGTSSALVDSITEQGLKRSGDKALKDAAKKTMTTIGNSYTESIEPVFGVPNSGPRFVGIKKFVAARTAPHTHTFFLETA